MLMGRLSITIKAYPPDRRARDLDNVLKILIDSLADAGQFLNDSQIDKLLIERMEVIKGGQLLIEITEIQGCINESITAS